MRNPWGLLTALLAVAACTAQDKLIDYDWREGFEGQAPRVDLWAKNGDCIINFLGPTDELAFEGKRSLKLDVTIKSGSYHYFGGQVRYPCEGTMKLSARVWVPKENQCRVGFGTNMVYPPTTHSGCGPAESFDKPTGEWKLVEVDLAERGKEGAGGVLGRQTGTVRAEDVGVILDRWALFCYGSEGKRCVVYLDDLRITGRAPAIADYEQDIKTRWQAYRQRMADQFAAWRARLAEAEQAMQAVGQVPAELKDLSTAIADTSAKVRGIIDRVDQAGYANLVDIEDIDNGIYTLTYGPETIRAVAEGLRTNQPYLTYSRSAITNDALTTAFPIPARVTSELSAAACRGEYEPVSVAIYAMRDLKGLTLVPTALKGPGGEIPADRIDVRIVKSWYQAGRGIGDRSHKMLVPELLLKDDELVRVDQDKRENYLRSTAPDGRTSYLLCSGKTSDNLAEVRPIDGATLKPVDVPAKTLRQFWVTVQVPDQAAPGAYRGELTIKTAAGSRAMPLTVTVHPFDLAPPKLIYSIYYRARLSADGQPKIDSEGRSEEQYRAEMVNLLQHGVAYPTCYQGLNAEVLRRTLEIRQEAGLPGGPFFSLGVGLGNTTDPKQLADLQGRIKQWLAIIKPFGYDQLYAYGFDEATGERLASQKASWQAAQEAGAKTFVACYLKTFEAMGKLLDLAILAGRPLPDEAAKYHGVGSKAFCYAYPQVGEEQPLTYRRNFGLVLWQAGFDGAMDYAYQHGFGHVWNDFDSDHYRDHNFTYPTVDGVVDTIQWEGFREAVDDVRYVTTLSRAIEEAKRDRRKLAMQASDWLESVDPTIANLDEVRAKMAEWIVKLR